MASTSLADPNLPTAVAAVQVIMSGNQAQSRDPHTRDNLKRDKNGFPTRKSRPSFCAPPESGTIAHLTIYIYMHVPIYM